MQDRRFFHKGLGPDEDALWRQAKRLTFAPGEALFHQGDRPTELFAVEEGRIKLWRASEAGMALTLGYYDGGDLVGAIAVMQDRPQTVTATALTEVVAFAWPASLIRRLVRQDPALAVDLAVLLAGRAEGLINRVEDLSSTSVEARVARALTRLTARACEDADSPSILLPITQREIADLTFTTVPTVSRVMKRWREAGIVEAGRGKVVILDLDALCALRGADG